MNLTTSSSFLLIGTSDVGKTHYGAQLLRRLNSNKGSMSLNNSDNIKPFVETMDQISRGRSGKHTPRLESSVSQWFVRRKSDGASFELNWPDYGGEQVSSMVNERRMPIAWRNKIHGASAWAFMVRPSHIRLPEDAMTRQVCLPATDDNEESQLSPQSRLVEILQMLKFKHSAYTENWSVAPPLCVMLSCYDELKTELNPREYCKHYIPLLFSFLNSSWPKNRVKFFGVSPLGKALNDTTPDEDYVAAGPENMGYIIGEDGVQSDDLLLPINWMLDASVSE